MWVSCCQQEESSSAGLTAFARGTRKKEGDLRKADEAEDLYRQSVQEANARQRELESTKSKVLVELRQLVYQCDMTMKAVSALTSQFTGNKTSGGLCPKYDRKHACIVWLDRTAIFKV